MRDPRRWLEDEGASRNAVKLLRAIDPPKAAPPHLRGLLGAQLSTMVSHGAAAAGTAWLKIALLSAVIGGGAAGTLIWKVAGVPAPLDVHVARQIESADDPSSPSPADTSEPPAGDVPDLPTSVAPAVRRPDRTRAPVPAKKPAEPRDSLAEEEGILEEARRTLPQNPAHALSLLRLHQSRFNHGQLTAERMYLSVDCLHRLGNLLAAKREAASLAEHYPNSTYARRLPLLLASPSR
jgi:hypothetical protein